MNPLIALSRKSLVALGRVLLILLGCAVLVPRSIHAQAPEWAWMGGSDTVYASGDYGMEYESSASNAPGARFGSVTWTDEIGRLWLFGGYGIGSSGSDSILNDLWVFTPYQGANGEWAWVGGSNSVPSEGTFGPPGIYGTEYQFAPNNIPGGRYYAVSWTEPNGCIWLFGGYGIDSAGNTGDLNDLWVFNPYRGAHGEWAWMGGSDTASAEAVYGTESDFAPSNIPGGRESAVTWTDPNGRLWLFSGMGNDSSGSFGLLNDVWVFDPFRGAHGEWAWISGSDTASAAGDYGAEYQFAASNDPGARLGAVAWSQPGGRVCIFGGYGWDSLGEAGDLNDVWLFDPSQGEWAWMGGSNTSDANGVYGTEYEFAPSNIPAPRDSAVAWTGNDGALWLFGGAISDYLRNDLWIFDPSQGADGEWAWMGGSDEHSTEPGPTPGPPGVYGTEYQFAASNSPGDRYDAASWTGQGGRLWLLGGIGFDSTGKAGYLNDLWELKVPQVRGYRTCGDIQQ
jgi:N-acetylneuraminic acid mutarotase